VQQVLRRGEAAGIVRGADACYRGVRVEVDGSTTTRGTPTAVRAATCPELIASVTVITA
jgi:hypothetical protein